MGARLLRRHWSDTSFTLLRRLAGLRVELVVLMVAEMIAKRYYRALYEGTDDPVLKTTFAQILRDEFGHVAFHCDYLQRDFAALPAPARTIVQLTWRLIFRAACLVVIYDHRSVLWAVRVAPGAFWRDCGQIFDEVVARIFGAPAAIEEPLAIKAE